MKRLLLLVTLTALCASMLAGCYRPFGAEPDRYPVSEHPNVYTLGWLRNDFYLQDAPVVTPEQGNRPMSVTVAVRLREAAWEDPIACQYRFMFFDERGVPLDPDPTWQFRIIEPRVSTYLQAGAPDIGAVDWHCEIRQNRVEADVR